MKVIIFEDVRYNAERLVQLLQKCVPELQVLAIIESVDEGLKWFGGQNEMADLVFMNIQFSDGTCFELFEQYEIKTPVIFTTAYDNYALRDFKVYNVDYLLKPIDIKDLERVLEKFEDFKVQPSNMLHISKIAAQFSKREHSRFIGRINSQHLFVKAVDIVYLYFLSGVTWAVTFTGQKVQLHYSLDQMEKMLDENFFFRTSLKLIVRIDTKARYPTSEVN